MMLSRERIGAGSVIEANAIGAQDVPPNMMYHNLVQPILKPLSHSTPRLAG